MQPTFETGAGGAGAAAKTEDLNHAPFRSWALQQNLTSLLGPEPGWDPEDDEPDVNPSHSAREPLRGQSYLCTELKVNPEFELRTKTSIALWASALITDSLNQWGPTGLAMSTRYFTFTIASVIVALLLTAIVYPRLSPKTFPAVEQTMLSFACALIAFQCAVTGGADSPYSVWLIFTTFYAAYFMPLRQVFWNTVAAVAIAMAPLVYEPGDTTANAALFAVLLSTVACAIAYTVFYRRKLSRSAERAVRYLALADPLTNVANLRAFEGFADDLAAAGGTFSVVMVDMNGLKGANTVFGYDTGDDLVKRLARLMKQVSEPSAQVARIGGDEFAVVLPGGSAQEARAWRNKFEQTVATHNERVRGRLPQVSVSIGEATFPTDGKDVAALIDAADRKMLQQKKPVVKPPYMIDDAAPISATRLLADTRTPSAPKRAFSRKEFGTQAGAMWTLSGLFVFTWLLLPGAEIPHFAATVALGIYCWVVAGLAFLSARAEVFRPYGWRIADFATLTIAAPGMWLTGGWQSPFQLFGVLVIAYYAQFFRGTQAWARIGCVLGFYTLAFWTSGDVSPAGESLYATIVTAELVIAAILQVNARTIDTSLGVIRDSATHDALTGTHNLLAFRDDLSALTEAASSDAAEAAARPALILADLDNFKRINDEAGHSGGDAVLREAVRRLETATGRASTIYRIGGDEFAILFEVDRFNEAAGIAERCRRALSFVPPDHVDFDGQVSASVGFSVLGEDMTSEAFVSTVESALAESKSVRGDTVAAGTSLML